jgi:D-3-phosphoglycerate dehydrogenase
MPTVLVTDYTFDSLDVEEAILRPLGAEIDARKCRDEAKLADLVAETDYVLTQFAPVTAKVIAAMSRTKLIVRYGIGVDNVDLGAARHRGIPVCNVPAYCLDEVADHAMALLLDATRRISANGRLVREGGWGLDGPLDRMKTLRDMTVGIIGFGRIGREVAARLSSFKCRTLAHDPYVPRSEFESLGVRSVAIDLLLAESDAVTLHCPSSPITRHLIGREAIAKMKPGAILINVARGDVIDTDALVEAVQSGRISAAGLDVTDPEPPPADSPLRSLADVVVTSHIASASTRAVRTLRETAAGMVARAIRGEPPINVVNGVTA